MKNDENNKKDTKKKVGRIKKILIICVIIIVVCFVMGRAVDSMTNKVESMSQEEQDAMFNKGDALIEWINED